ncbi:hypothetical protein V8C86DRAFT_2703033, partial [Haematococcus lacustris]
ESPTWLVIFMQVLATKCTDCDSVCCIGTCVLLRIYWRAARYSLHQSPCRRKRARTHLSCSLSVVVVAASEDRRGASY